MAKFEVTPELSTLVRTVRVQNNVSANEVSRKIGKDASFLSRLENNKMKYVEQELLDSIFHAIFTTEDEYRLFIDNRLETLLDSLTLHLTKDEVYSQIWFYNYDTVKRSIPIPEELIDAIADRMKKASITIEQLVNRINANEEIVSDGMDVNCFPINEWKHNGKNLSIRMKVNYQDIVDIFNKKRTKCSYVTMNAIVHYLFKFEQKIGMEVTKELCEDTITFLNKYKFYSLDEKWKFVESNKLADSTEQLMSEFDIETRNYLSQIINLISSAADFDVQWANKNLSQLISTMDWDIGFAITVMGLDFVGMKDQDFQARGQFILELKELIKKYSVQESQVSIRQY